MKKLEIYKKYRKDGFNAKTAWEIATNQAKHVSYDYDSSWYDYRNGQKVEVEGLTEGDEILLAIDYEHNPDLPWDWADSWGTVESHEYGDELGNGYVELWSGGRRGYCYKYNFREALQKSLACVKEYYPNMGKAWQMREALDRVHAEIKWFYGYCNDSWGYVWLEARLVRDGEIIDSDSIGLVDSESWHDCADDLINTMVRASKATVFAGSTVGCV